MLNTLFYFVINMSIAAFLIGLIIIIIRQIKIIPKLGITFLWSLVFIRLILPFTLPSRISFLNVFKGLIKKDVRLPLNFYIESQNDILVVENESLNISMSNFVGTAKTYYPVTYKNTVLESVFSTAAFIWIIVVIAALLTISILYFLSKAEIKNAYHIRDNIYSSDMVKTPMVFGLLKQKIIIPKDVNIDLAENKFILLHEEVHIKRHDNLFRIIAIFTACIHWFNPFIWIFINLFEKDMEISCDEKVIKNLQHNERLEYAKSLVNFSVSQKVFMSTAFSKSNVKVRVLNVLSYKKLSLISSGFIILFGIAIAIALITNPL